MHCDTAPFDNNDLRLALKYAIDREAILERVLGGFGTIGNDYPVNANYALAHRHRAARLRSRQGGLPLTRSPATRTRSCCAPPTPPFPAPSMRPSFSRRARRRPASRSTCAASRKTATGRKSGTSSRSAPPTGAAARRRTRATRPPTSRPRNGTTPASSARTSTRCCCRRAPNSTRPSGGSSTATMALMVRDEGGLILPVFNDYINASSSRLKGFDPRHRQRPVQRLHRQPGLVRGLSRLRN